MQVQYDPILDKLRTEDATPNQVAVWDATTTTVAENSAGWSGSSGGFVALSGDQSISGTKSFEGDVRVNGTFYATSAVVIASEQIALSSNFLTLNSNVTGSLSGEDAGIIVNRGDAPAATLLWDGPAQVWRAGVSGSLFEVGDAAVAASVYSTVSSSSATWETVTSKLDSSEFQSYSGGIEAALTAKLDSSIYAGTSGGFDSARSTVASNSATWGTVAQKLDASVYANTSGANSSVYSTVNSNSASWSSVTGKLDLSAFSSASAGFASLTGDQTIGGTKTFSSAILGSLSGSVSGSLAGNSSTASRFLSPVLINGAPFDGSASVTVSSDVAPGASGNVMTSNGTLWTSVANPSEPAFTNLAYSKLPTGGGTWANGGKLLIGDGDLFSDYSTGGSTGGGAIRLASNANAAYFATNSYYNGSSTVRSRAGGASQILFNITNGPTGGDVTFQNAATGNADSAISWTDAMTIKTGGNVGIGCTPSYKMQIASSYAKTDTTYSEPMMIGSNEGSTSWGLKVGVVGNSTAGSRYVQFQTGDNSVNGGSIVMQTNGGNVGIGTGSPACHLQMGEVFGINQDINSAYIGVNASSNSTYIKSQYGVRLWLDSATGDMRLQNASAGTAGAGITWGTNLIVKNNGYVGIGNTSPSSLLTLGDSIHGYIRFGGPTISVGNIYHDDTYAIHIDTNGNSLPIKIDGSARYNAANSANWDILSDRRLKKNIATIENALDKLTSLRGVTYQWIADDAKSHMGMVAQEVEEVFPQWVTTDGRGFKGLLTSGDTALIIEAIKELARRIVKIEQERIAV